MKIRWFSGGEERKSSAIPLIDELISELNKKDDTEPVIVVLNKYKDELIKKETSVPFILSRFNVDVSNVVRDNNIIMTDKESDILREIRQLSSIRYGYQVLLLKHQRIIWRNVSLIIIESKEYFGC